MDMLLGTNAAQALTNLQGVQPSSNESNGKTVFLMFVCLHINRLHHMTST